MSTLTPTRPRPPVPAPRPAPRPDPYPRPAAPIRSIAPAAFKPCPGCKRVWCTCPRKGWGYLTTAGTNPRIQPGKGTTRPPNGTVLPPAPGWGPKTR